MYHTKVPNAGVCALTLNVGTDCEQVCCFYQCTLFLDYSCGAQRSLSTFQANSCIGREKEGWTWCNKL